MGKTMKARQEIKIDPRFLPVVEAFAADPQVSGGKMMSSYGLKVNGKIFAMFGGDQFVTKLPRDRVDELVASGRGVRFDPRRNGRVMKEWVAFPAAGPDWVQLAKEAYPFVKHGK